MDKTNKQPDNSNNANLAGLQYQTYLRIDDGDTVSRELDPIINEEDTTPSSPVFICPNGHGEMKLNVSLYQCSICGYTDW